jgi:hypothetical protein
MKAAAAPVGTPWLWTFAYGAHRDYWPLAARAQQSEGKRRIGVLMAHARRISWAS